MRFFRDFGDDYMTVRTLIGLASAHPRRCETDQARTHAEQAHTLAEKASARHEIANAFWLLADIAHHHGDTSERNYLQRAHELFTQLSSLNAEATQQRLDQFNDDS